MANFDFDDEDTLVDFVEDTIPGEPTLRGLMPPVLVTREELLEGIPTIPGWHREIRTTLPQAPICGYFPNNFFAV